VFVNGDACLGEPEVIGIGATSYRKQEMGPAYLAITAGAIHVGENLFAAL
jgi:hypothetical protein